MKSKNTYKMIICGIFTALLIASQYALSFLGGIEVVTVLLLCYSFLSEKKYAMLSATAFSLIRCFVFGFYPTVIIEYLIYYNSFALFFSFFGKKMGDITLPKHILIVLLACIFTCLFTLLDDIISPLVYGFDFYPYFIASIPFMIPQIICTFLTVALLFLPIVNTANDVMKK